MPRRPRLNLIGMPLHIVQRGNNRAACFFAEEDYHFYLHWLGIYAKQYGRSIHAYVLMTNHVHLLLKPSKPHAPAKLMQSLGRRYVQYINKVYHRSGTLWEGRYKASLVHAEEYLLACHRYIEMNPVRANMIAHPREYAWSSYAANVDGKSDLLLTCHDLVEWLGATVTQRQQAYAALFRTELDVEVIDAIRAMTHKGQVLGGQRLKDDVAAMLGNRVMSGTRGRKRKDVNAPFHDEQMGLGFERKEAPSMKNDLTLSPRALLAEANQNIRISLVDGMEEDENAHDAKSSIYAASRPKTAGNSRQCLILAGPGRWATTRVMSQPQDANEATWRMAA
ncbi:MAG: transposase [Betaproteobacteria bacterium]